MPLCWGSKVAITILAYLKTLRNQHISNSKFCISLEEDAFEKLTMA